MLFLSSGVPRLRAQVRLSISGGVAVAVVLGQQKTFEAGGLKYFISSVVSGWLIRRVLCYRLLGWRA